MKSEEVLFCAFPQWYHKFQQDTIESIIIPLPSEVLEYFQENGTVVLPAEENGSLLQPDTDDSDDGWDSDSQDGSQVVEPEFPDFSKHLKSSIESLGGSVFPKLNWSSPKDAFWITYNRSLKCTHPSDIYLLIKSSTFVAHDLTSPFKDCVDKEEPKGPFEYCLILRKWMEINPSEEFRCFVKDGELFGISQRDPSQYYSYINEDRDLILADIEHFWEEKIRDNFVLSSYVFDVYRPRKNKVILLDFGPFGETSDSLLFSWSELKGNCSEENKDGNGFTASVMLEMNDLSLCGSNEPTGQSSAVKFRFISDETGVQPSPYMQYGLPLDIMTLSSAEEIDQVRYLREKLENGGDDASTSSSEDSPEC